MAFLKENLINCLKPICPKEYTLRYFKGVIYFENRSEETIKKVAITFADYHPFSVTFTGVSNTLDFFSIENEISKKSDQLCLDYSSAYSIRLSVPENREDPISDFKIESENEFLNIRPYFEEIVNRDCTVLLNKYENLNEVANLLSNLEPREVVPYIQGAQLFVKTILILKESNHPKYREKRDEFHEVLKKQAPKKEIYSQQLRLFEVMFYE